jgi:RNA polymerase sigma-70 factor (ECF subfamily)
MAERITNETARELRAIWFRYLDTLEPVRPQLYAFCLRLTGSVFDAEDLVQDALLKGFSAIARLDRPSERIMDSRAYLCRIATNEWIDRQRRSGRAIPVSPSETSGDPPVLTKSAAAALFDRASPQERAAVVLKDVFDFTLDEIADLLATSVGAVKSALHRGRERLDEKPERMPPRGTPASTELIDRFIEAFRSRDVEAVTALLLESVTYEVQGVGFERGRKGEWININIGNQSIEGVRGERHLVEGEWVAIGLRESEKGRRLLGVTRLEEADGKVARVINYFYCPDTLSRVAALLGMLPPKRAYHQEADVLARMIAAGVLPWQETS